MREAGLLKQWSKEFAVDVHQCLDHHKKKQDANHAPALTLKSLTGSFVILCLGYTLSFIVLLSEKVRSKIRWQ